MQKKPDQQDQIDHRYVPLILDAIDQGIFTVDESTRITSFNRGAELITGYCQEEAIGRQCSEIFRTDLCDGICPLKQSMGERESIARQKVRIQTRDGRSVPILVSTSPLVAPDGSLIGGVEMFRDVSGMEALQRKLDGQYQFEDIISRNPEMERIFATLPLIADSQTTVLVTGESGTGKELVARALHNQSGRAERPFVAFNCAAVPETLIESELFGYRKGAFTDARQDKPGRIAQADGGTLFLDEVGDLPLSIQAKLLRFLQDRRYEPLGSSDTISADVRIIAATHVDLRQAVADGRFREDLFYRIHIIEIPLPPLSRRTEDIPLLVRHFVRNLSGSSHKNIAGVSDEALAMLVRYPWPGNIRELENAIEHAVVLCRSSRIGPEHLPPHLFATPVRPNAIDGTPGPAQIMSGGLGQLERDAILAALDRAGGNRTRAARELGIHRTTLLRKLKKLGVV